MRPRSRRVEPVLYDVEVARRQRHGAEAVERLIDRVVLESSISFRCARDDHVEFGERPAVNLPHLAQGHRVARRVEAVEVAEREARGVSNLAVRVRDALQDFLRAAHVLFVVGGDDPEAQYVSARVLDELVGRDGVTRRLVHRTPLRVQSPAVRDDHTVRRARVRREADHQRGVEPAAELIAAFEVHVRGPAQALVLLALQHGD